MGENRHKIIPIILVLLFIFTMGNAYASDHRLESSEIDVYINQNGSATIKEKRIANLVEGTESYIIIENLGKAEIIDFKVYENEEEFQFIDNWDIDKSREEKMKKNGIVTTSEGYELSWGIGEYGKHEYNLEYTITNFIKGLKDSQMIYWKFINDGTNIPPENVKITISSDYEFTEKNEKIWGFGFGGMVQFDEGKIVATSNRPFSEDNHVTILTKLPEDMFNTEDNLDQSFKEIQDTAFVGSDYDEGVYEEGGFDKSTPILGDVVSKIISGVFRLGIFMFLIITIFKRKSKPSNKSPKKFKRKYKEEYYRDYPYEGEFLDIYYIPYIMGAADFENLLTGFILKWINEDRLITEEEEVGWIFKKDKTNLKFLNVSNLDNDLENKLFQMMLEAAGPNRVLEEKEFTKWARSNSRKIEKWEKEVKEYSKNKLEELGYLNIIEKKILFFRTSNYELTEEGKEMEINIYKYINYLYDFSLLNEHKAINVKIWDNIMVWAGFLGLTEVVSKQFEKLYPKYTQETIYTGNTIFLTSHLARNISRAKVSASASSGAGGMTSMGGGGGSFGGGSGGGTR